ncbi:glycoside hydrolase family 76 protein [uncultured Mucilaginibacter sp.]|uniref:glycoside hydrolase family 76 protein n=1 Tax=uncultured Mucilaginibacter sp. TaxID=797541 RepID=UPI0025F6E724|nr:glycoside hydrolase family 76 protein [uncultured Mucilaginibacter sp.]
MTKFNLPQISLSNKVRLLQLFIVFASIHAASCSKGGDNVDNPKPVPETKGEYYSTADATTAFNAFNTAYYSANDKLYYSTTERKDIGAIWTQAIYWDMAMHIYERTKDQTYYNLVTDMYDGGFKRYDGYNWDNTTTWFIYDDMMWWVISLARAYNITKNETYLTKAKAGFERVWNGSYDPIKGGMFWDFKHSGKNACINYPTAIAAMRLYQITKDEQYLNKAKSIYNWSRENLFDISNGRVADHKIGNNNPGYEDYTYNQGTCIGAAVMLYEVTKEQKYLDDANLAARYTQQRMSDSQGILPAEGDYNEQGVLKAIFAQYLAQLAKVYPEGNYDKWAVMNANYAWNNRDLARNIMHRNYKVPCPKGVVQSYESSSAVAFMQLFTPVSSK